MSDGPFAVTVILPTAEVVEAVVMSAGGPPGLAGAAATVSVGTTTTGVAGSNATVANTGTATAAVFEFTIPRGTTGAAGTGVPVGGTATQALTKIDSTDFNTHWVSIPSADTVSARLVSLSAELTSQIASTSAALGSADNVLSARITSAEAAAGVSVTSAKVQTASAAATSADAHANTVSARVVSVSAELASLVGIASALASTAVVHANTASAAATSADSHANAVSIRLVSASAELASIANVVSARAVSISSELASLIASGDAALSTRVDTASAVAGAADSHANVVSARAVSISAELASLIASGDSFLSARITSAEGITPTVSVTSAELHSLVEGYSTIATAAGTTALSANSPPEQFFTGTTTQIVTLPDVTGLVLGRQYLVNNDSTGIVTVQSSGANTVVAMAAGTAAVFTCILTTGTTAASWSYRYSGSGGGTGTVTNTGGALTANAVVLGAGGADIKTVAGIVTDGSGKITLDTGLAVKNPSGFASTIIRAGASGVSFTLTLPEKTTTLMGIDTNDNVTNKLFNSSCKVDDTGLVFRNSILTPTTLLRAGASSVISYTVTLPEATTTLVGTDTADTLTNKSIVATQLTGTVPTARLGSGTANSTTFLRGDQTWVSVAAGATSVTSAEVQVASAAATSADVHANTVSQRVVSVSAELASLLASTSLALETHINAVSAAGGGGAANIVSARVVSVSAELASLVQIASAAATSADAHANTVSARLASASLELISLFTSVDNKLSASIQTASAAATSADAHANTVSVRVVSVSAELASLVQIASAAATSADAHANTVSVRAVSISNELGSLLASASAALETHANTASAAATSADAHANTVSARVVSVSAELMSQLASTSAALLSAVQGFSTIATAAATTSISVGSPPEFFLTGSTTQTFQLPVVSTLVLGRQFMVKNDSSGVVTVQSSGANTIVAMAAGSVAVFTCIATTGTGTASWSYVYSNTASDVVSARAVSISAELVSLMNSADAALSARVTSVAGLGGGAASVTSAEFFSNVQGYSTIATAAGTTSISVGSPPEIFFTGSTTQIFQLPDVTTLVLGKQYLVKNDSTGSVTVQSSGANTIVNMVGGTTAVFTCIAITGTGTASWSYSYSNAGADVVSARVVSVSAELASLLVSAVARRATNTANQAVTSASTGVTVSGVSVALVSSQVYIFQFQIPFTTTLTNGIMVKVVGPATNTFIAHFQIPGAVGNAAVAPAVNGVSPFQAETPAIGTAVSTTSITLTATTLMVDCWGTINPSANGSIKFVIGPNTSGSTPLTPLKGASVLVWRVA